MISRRHAAVYLILSLLLLPTAGSSLEWTQEQIEISAKPDDERAEVAFEFQNTSEKPVTISSTRSSCGCTVPALDKRVYAPGERGELRAVFEFGSRTGPQSKTITVQTDEPDQSLYQLNLKVDIPKLFEVDRQFVIWKRGDAPEAKTIEVRILEPDLADIAAVESRDSRFTAEIEATDDPKVHRIVIKPSATEQTLQSAIVVKTDFPEKNPRAITVYALVR